MVGFVNGLGLWVVLRDAECRILDPQVEILDLGVEILLTPDFPSVTPVA